METFSKAINKIMRVVFGVMGTIMILIATYEVFARDVLKISQPWTDEALKFLDIWMIFIVAALVFLRDEQISLTLVEDSSIVRNKPELYHSMKIFQYLIAAVLNLEITRELITIVSTQMSTGEITTNLKYPLWLLNSGMLIGCILTFAFALVKIADQVRSFNVDSGVVE